MSKKETFKRLTRKISPSTMGHTDTLEVDRIAGYITALERFLLAMFIVFLITLAVAIGMGVYYGKKYATESPTPPVINGVDPSDTSVQITPNRPSAVSLVVAQKESNAGSGCITC